MFVTDFSQYANLLRQKQKLSQEVLLSAFLPQSGCYNAVKRTEQPHIKRVFVPQGSRLQYRRFQLRRKGEFDEYAI